MFNYIRKRFHPLWRLRKLAWYRALQKRLDFPVKVRSGKLHFWVMLLRDFAFVAPNKEGLEAATHRVVEKIVREFNITHFFDVGANVGSFAWHVINVKPNIGVILFEPDDTNIRLLKKTVHSNKLTDVKIWEGVVSNTTKPTEFLVDDSSGATGSIKDYTSIQYSLHAAYGMSRKVLVAATMLDTYNASLPIGSCILVKIDVEGAEGEVLDGARRFITQFRPFIVVECFDKENLASFENAGYAAFGLPENCNYILLPREMVASCKERKILSDEAPEIDLWSNHKS